MYSGREFVFNEGGDIEGAGSITAFSRNDEASEARGVCIKWKAHHPGIS